MVSLLEKSPCKKLVRIVIILLQMVVLVQCFCDWRLPYFAVFYPKAGESLTLEVAGFGKDKPVLWRKDDKRLDNKTCNGDQNCKQCIPLNTTNLKLNKITQEDSGKYIIEVFCPERRVTSFEVLVQDSPFVVSDCKDMTVKEGGNITCVCKTTSGSNPLAEVKWTHIKPDQKNSRLKTSTGILRLENISKNQSGTYRCNSAISQNSTNTTSFDLKVVSEDYLHGNNSVEIAFLQAFQKDCKLTIICEARGLPEPQYTILHDGTVLEYGNVFTLDTKKTSALGAYECLAKNRLGSERRSLFLNENFLEECEMTGVCNKNGTEWKIWTIVGVSSFVAGLSVFFVVMCCCKNRRRKNENCQGNYDDVLSKPVKDSSGYVEERMEMRLRYTTEDPVEVGSKKTFSTDDDGGVNDGKYDEVSPRSQTKCLMVSAAEIVEMRLRHTSKSPGAEEERDSAEYDIPESGNRHESEYYYDNNYTKFVAFHDKEDKKYEN